MQIAFYKGRKRFFNRFVSWWDRGPYSHMEVIYADGQAASSSFMDRGIRFKRIEFDADKWDVVDVPNGLFDEHASRNWFVAHVGRRYDFLGLIRFAFDAIPERKSKWFCSEACLESLGIKDPWRFTPNAAYSLITSMKDLHNV